MAPMLARSGHPATLVLLLAACHAGSVMPGDGSPTTTAVVDATSTTAALTSTTAADTTGTDTTVATGTVATDPTSTGGTTDETTTAEVDATTTGTDATTSTTTGTTAAEYPCVDGPELLADGLELPFSFSRQGEWIYVANFGDVFNATGGGLYRVPVDGGAPELLWAGQSRSVAASPAGVFWTELYGVARRTGLDGGASQVLAPGEARPIAVDATHVYWATKLAVFRMPLAGGPVESIAAGFSISYELALDDERVYWTAGDTVEVVGKDGSGRGTVATGQGYARGVASDGEHVYWLGTKACALQRAPVAGGPSEVLWDQPDADLYSCPSGTAKIALHGEHVYWGGGYGVYRVPRTGGAQQVIADGDPTRYTRDIFVDDVHVYWLKHAGYCEMGGSCKTGAVYRTCRPR